MTRGISGAPTIVHNVETLAHIALIARFGASWFRSRGVPEDPGTRLVTISGAVAEPGVLEVAGGTTLRDIVNRAGGVNEPVHAMLVGGYHGCWVPWTSQVAASALTAAELAQFGASPGAGVLVALPTQRCGVQAAADIAAYLAGESAGPCGPCRNGLPAIAAHLDDLAGGRAGADTVAQLHRLSDVVQGRGACRHPDGTARFIRSTLHTFSAEVEHHLAGRCTAERNRPAPSAQRPAKDIMSTVLVIDWTRCEARGVCLDLLPGVLRPDDWGYPIGRHPSGNIPVTISAHEAATTAVRECPRLALRLATRP